MKLSEVNHPNFIHNGQIYLVRCPECKSENWAPAVSTGECAWCGKKFELESEKCQNQ